MLRGSDRIEIKALLEEEPRLVREADRKYFEKIGFTAREFVYGDAIARHSRTGDLKGIVAHLVKPNSPADIAGLRPDDWIKEIDGARDKGLRIGRRAPSRRSRRTSFARRRCSSSAAAATPPC